MLEASPAAMQTSTGPGPVIALEEVSRLFGEFAAVSNASLTIPPFGITAIIGENGAGKSTLLKLAAGLLPPTSGVVRQDGSPLRSRLGTTTAAARIGMVFQHFMLVPCFTALENIILGAEPVSRFQILDLGHAERRVTELMKQTGLSVALSKRVEDLSVGERQRVELLKVLFRGARALLLDEPTAVLSPLEADDLYATLRRLAEGGATIGVVTHRLDEVTRFADEVTVMRRGHTVMSLPRGSVRESSVEELTRAIVGGEAPPPFSPPRLPDEAADVLVIRGLRALDADGRVVLGGINLTVRAGEIIGIAGVDGNGQREFVRAIAGLQRTEAGEIRVAPTSLASLGVRARRCLVGIVHEDRQVDGLVLEASVGDNLVLGDIGSFDERQVIARRMERFTVEPPDPTLAVGELSGGNQQKIVVGRVLDRLADMGGHAAVVLAQPTRGVDVGAARVLHEAVGDAAAAGLAVIVISSDLAELRSLSHRIVVMRRGSFVAELPRDASDAEIGRAMLGVSEAVTS